MPQYAAVDIGSNSIRLLVADARLSAETGVEFRRLAEDRQVTRLGESVFTQGTIDPSAIESTCQVLARMRQIWQKYEIRGIRAVATSATRDASNQFEFLEQASAAIGVNIETISGQEESRLVQLGVQALWPHPQDRILIIDMGGGSTELIVAEHGRVAAAYSRPLGAVRLQTTFLEHDPPAPAEVQRLRDFIDEKLEIAVRRIRGHQYRRVIGTSSSAAALVSAVNRVARSKREMADRLKATRPQLRKLFDEVSKMDLAGRRRITGIGPRRAEIIIPGAALFLTVLERFELPAVYYSTAGVRDGIIADLMQRGTGRELYRLAQPQRQAVEAMGRQFDVDVRHARRLAEFAHDLFLSLEPMHNLFPSYGKLLEAACYLCDTGHMINSAGHHKHAHYIVSNGDLAGFTNIEQQMIALLCRYHRKALPSVRHNEFQSLLPEMRSALLLLIPILRLADGLDRTRGQHVQSVDCEITASGVILTLHSTGEPNLEQWAAERVAGPFQQIYDKKLSVVVKPA